MQRPASSNGMSMFKMEDGLDSAKRRRSVLVATSLAEAERHRRLVEHSEREAAKKVGVVCSCHVPVPRLDACPSFSAIMLSRSPARTLA